MILMNNVITYYSIISLGSSRPPLKITDMGIWDGEYFCRTGFKVCTDSTEKRCHHPTSNHSTSCCSWSLFHQVGCTLRMSNPIGIGLKLNSKGYEGVMSNSWQATLMSLCIERGMDGQLGSVLIQLAISDSYCNPVSRVVT